MYTWLSNFGRCGAETTVTMASTYEGGIAAQLIRLPKDRGIRVFLRTVNIDLIAVNKFIGDGRNDVDPLRVCDDEGHSHV